MWKQQNDSLIAQLNRKTCEVKDLKSQLQEKKLEINKVKERLNKIKGKPVDTKFEKPLVGRQPTTFKFQKPLVLGNCLHSLTLLREKSFQSPGDFQFSIVNTMNNQTGAVFRYLFEKEKLYRSNFIDWYRNLRIVLTAEDKLNSLEQPLHVASVLAPRQVLPKEELKTMFSQQAEQELLQTVKAFQCGSKNRYDGFVHTYNMHGMGKTVNELHAMLKLH
ncbi:hypothetical protein Tco_0691192 [Tanacetum coccineum]